ncbi:FABP family protein [Antribacter sp. KLBMP9083]|uniref:Ferric nitrobindin-like protein n=1 Tax=Antribacter soli TaxID=2910976 RepID=A0AA41QEP7_9MICO|nr:FABP family protein [Antribacter soli]MCF4122095.1 FABP family protein [Antribacter soli]
MAFSFPEGLAPEVYPLAWLVGHWRGEGVIDYPGIDKRTFVQHLVFDHDGGPYLRFESTLRVLDSVVPDALPAEGEWPERVADPAEGEAPAKATGTPSGDAGTVWSTETGYWRVSTDRPEGLEDAKHALEVLVSDASGRLSLYLGAVGNGRIDLATDFIARTSTATEVSASKRLYGLVEGRLLWVEELAAFGEPLRSYASAELDRL